MWDVLNRKRIEIDPVSTRNFKALYAATVMNDIKNQMQYVESMPSMAGMSEDQQELAQGLANYIPDSVEEKKLLRKIDLSLMPCLWIMYVLNYVDRTNIVSVYLLSPHLSIFKTDKAFE